MNITPEQIQNEIKKAKLGALIFFIISMSCFASALALIIVAIVVGASHPDEWFIFGYIAGICLSLGFTFLVLRSVFFTVKIRFLLSVEEAQKNPAIAEDSPLVDAKPVESFNENNSRENKLFQQYENLYNQGYITKEELEQKRKELLAG